MWQQIITRIVKLLTPKPHIQLGSWHLKHDHALCEKYLTNNYAEPGYPNSNKIYGLIKIKT